MDADGWFPAEDFVEALTSQLDRAQDALRLKAVNRPLTYALKELTLDLRVFVDMDAEGNVRFRPSGPNEAAASTVHLSFTTITSAMIAENAISLSVARSPTLEELGLEPQERRRLERIGVRNVAQLQRLGSSTGSSTVARFSGVPVQRLREALQSGRPQLDRVVVEPVPPQATPAPRPPVIPEGAGPLPSPTTMPVPPVTPVTPGPSTFPAMPGTPTFPTTSTPVGGPVVATPIGGVDAPVGLHGDGPLHSHWAPVIRVPTGGRRVRLDGRNLLGEDGPPTVRLDGVPLDVSVADDGEQLLVELPRAGATGALEIELGEGEVVALALDAEPAPDAPPEAGRRTPTDPATHLGAAPPVPNQAPGRTDDPWVGRR